MGKKFVVLVAPEDEGQVNITANQRAQYKVGGVIRVEGGASNLANIKSHPLFINVKNLVYFTLNRGDVLFLPKKWLHYIHNLEFSVSVSCWGKPFATI